MVIIGNLVTKICSGSVTQADILSAMGQVIYWFSLLSEEWRRKAFWLFDKLWKKRQVSMSTHTTLPKEIYDAVNFEDARIKSLTTVLGVPDTSVLILGELINRHLSRSLHDAVSNVKQEVQANYGIRGITIVRMVNTKDISLVLDEIDESPEKKLEIFEYWIANYPNISCLLSHDDIDKQLAGEKILETAKRSPREYIFVHISWNMEYIQKTIKLVEQLRDENKLNYTGIDQNISACGFLFSLKLTIRFN